jgi:YcxB-like protein
MRVSYRITFLDRLIYQVDCFRRHPLVLISVAALFSVVTFTGNVPGLLLNSEYPLFTRIIAFLVMELLLALFILAMLMSVAILGSVSAMFGQNSFTYGERTLTLYDEAFIAESQHYKSEIRWQSVQKLVRTRTHIFMYVSKDGAVIVPRRAFESLVEMEVFYDFCKKQTSYAA